VVGRGFSHPSIREKAVRLGDTNANAALTRRRRSGVKNLERRPVRGKAARFHHAASAVRLKGLAGPVPMKEEVWNGECGRKKGSTFRWERVNARTVTHKSQLCTPRKYCTFEECTPHSFISIPSLCCFRGQTADFLGACVVNIIIRCFHRTFCTMHNTIPR